MTSPRRMRATCAAVLILTLRRPRRGGSKRASTTTATGSIRCSPSTAWPRARRRPRPGSGWTCSRMGQRGRRGGRDRLHPGGDPAERRQSRRRRLHGRARRASGETVAIDYREKAGRARLLATCSSTSGARPTPRSRAPAGSRPACPARVAGLALALERYGTLSLAEALAPAIALAGSGIEVGPQLADRARRASA